MSSATQNCALSICEQCMLKLIYGTLNYILSLQFEVCLFFFCCCFFILLAGGKCDFGLPQIFICILLYSFCNYNCQPSLPFYKYFHATPVDMHTEIFLVYFHFVIMSYLKNSTKFRQKFDQLSIQPNVF